MAVLTSHKVSADIPGRDSLRCLVIAPHIAFLDTVEIRGWPCYGCVVVKVLIFHLASPHNTLLVREKGASFFPDGDASLFHWAFSKNRLMGRWKHPIIAGQGLTPRLLTWPLLAWVGMGQLCVFPVVFGGGHWLTFFCLVGYPFLGPHIWKHRLSFVYFCLCLLALSNCLCVHWNSEMHKPTRNPGT